MAQQHYKTTEKVVLAKEDHYTKMDGLQLGEEYTVTHDYATGNIRVSPSTLSLLHSSSSFKQKKQKGKGQLSHAVAFVVCLVLSKFVR